MLTTRLPLSSVLLLVLVASPEMAHATVLQVPTVYLTIQAAINASAPGDVVVVGRGTYRENLDFKGKAITVRSTDPSSAATVAATIVNGKAAGSVVSFKSGEGAASVLRGLTLTNGESSLGGGVYCSGASPTIAANVIHDNEAGKGGGVYCGSHSSPTLSNNTIRANDASGLLGCGGGLFCSLSSPSLSGNTIVGNTSYLSGGGLYCNNSSPTLTNDLLAGNVSAGFGGGIACVLSSPRLVNDTISGNSAPTGGGVYCENGSSPVLKNTILAFSSQGGGLYVSTTAATASRPAVTYCDVYSNRGGNYVHWVILPGTSGNMSKDPLFVSAGRGDFHLRSTAGRWNPATGSWVVDTTHSPCIDAGDPRSSFRLEPRPNGGRVNLGAYGNTRAASKSAVLTAVAVAAAARPTRGGAELTVGVVMAAAVEVTITTISGRPVAVLPERTLPAGVSTLLWNGRTRQGMAAPPGRYLVLVRARGEYGDQAQAMVPLSLQR